ncbi:uncharacterized protein [Argopecten irradians]|uniref:uncharacterized protein n=1 Tax=Argopecten irradians TaxID=31199 RepID=UPI003717C1BF
MHALQLPVTDLEPPPPGPITRYNIDVFEPRVDLWWTAATGLVEKYKVVLRNCEAEVVAEVVTEETELSIPFPIINNKISPAFNVEVYSLAYGVHSKPQTERVHVEVNRRAKGSLKLKLTVGSGGGSGHRGNRAVNPFSDNAVINNKISPAFNVEIYSLAYGVHSKPQTERVHVEDFYLIIQELHATQEDSKSVILSWNHPFYRLVDSYEVQWTEEHSDQYTVMAVDSETTSVIIPDLTPDTTYKFRMASVLPKACILEGNFLSTDITVTLGPSMPGNVDQVASTITSTSFDLHWKASEILVDHYIVKISGDSSFRAEYKTEDQTPSVRIENLEMNTFYQLDIYAVRGNMKSVARTEVLKTKNIQVYWGCMMTAILTGGFAAVGVSAFAPVLGAFGFGAAGIGKGTLAASWMSTYGGSVASGGLFSTLQSLGVVGLTASAKAAIIATGMALGCIVEVV